MTEETIIKSISVNLLRMSEWYYQDPEKTGPLCVRYLEQSKKLAEQVSSQSAKRYLKKLDQLTFSSPQPDEHTAERCLTIGVLLLAV